MDAPVVTPAASASPHEGRWRSTLAVLGVLIGVVFGGYVTAAALAVPSGPPVSVAGVVRVQPLAGWQVAGRQADPPGVKLTRGNGNLDVFVVAAPGGPAALLEGYVRLALGSQGRVSVSPRIERVTLGSGTTGLRVSYVGTFGKSATPLEGEVTTLVAPSGAGVVFDGWAPQGLLDFVNGDLHEMIDTAEAH